MIHIVCKCGCTFWWGFFPPLDLEIVFRNIDTRHTDSGMSFRALRNRFGTGIPNGQTMKCFDTDGNRRYTLAELKSATGLWATPSLRSGEQYWNTRKNRGGGGVGSVCSIVPSPVLEMLHLMNYDIFSPCRLVTGMSLPTHSKFIQNPWPHQRKPTFPGNRRKWIRWNCQCYFSCSIVALTFAPYFHVLI